jgi:hypothetical protein
MQRHSFPLPITRPPVKFVCIYIQRFRFYKNLAEQSITVAKYYQHGVIVSLSTSSEGGAKWVVELVTNVYHPVVKLE